MNKIVITNSTQFEEVINTFEQVLTRVKDIFENEKKNAEEINGTSTWTCMTQEVIYSKYKLLSNNFAPIEESLQLYINFMKKTLEDYKAIEAHIEKSAEASSVQLNVNS